MTALTYYDFQPAGREDQAPRPRAMRHKFIILKSSAFIFIMLVGSYFSIFITAIPFKLFDGPRKDPTQEAGLILVIMGLILTPVSYLLVSAITLIILRKKLEGKHGLQLLIMLGSMLIAWFLVAVITGLLIINHKPNIDGRRTILL
jgi:uncharacterized membrane protein